MKIQQGKTIANMLKLVTKKDEKAIQTALEPFISGSWKLSDKLSDEEKIEVEDLLEKLSSVDEKEISALLEIKNPIVDPEDRVTDEDSMNKRKLARYFVLLCSYIFYDEFHYPQPQIGKYDIADNKFEKLKWLYRYWFNQLEVPEKGSDLVQHFRNQDLEFTLKDFKAESNSKVSLSSGGDLLAVDVLTPENTPHLFDGIKDFYSSADLVCANLESTVDSKRYPGRKQEKGQPAKMNTSKAMFHRFRKDGGINYFSTANNHAFDWGEQGVLATLEVLRKSGAYHSGTNDSLQQQEDVLIIEKNGIKIAMLSYTFDLNGHGLPKGKDYLVNVVRFNDEICDLSMVTNHVARAKEKGADIIIACCHWGWEFEMYPHVNIVQTAQEMITIGVDVILGNHPHVSQPMERFTCTGNPNGLIVYSYGDFVSYHPESRNSKIAYVTKFDIVKGKCSSNEKVETRITNLRLLPIYILNEKLPDGRFNCRILKFYDVFENPDKYGLTQLEKKQLPHLNDVVLRDILLPQKQDKLLVK